MSELSPHAKHVVALIKNCGDMAIIHQNIGEARQELKNIRKYCREIGFEVPSDLFSSLDMDIIDKPPAFLSDKFMDFLQDIEILDREFLSNS